MTVEPKDAESPDEAREGLTPEPPAPEPPPEPRWRPAAEPTCCGSGCEDCPF